MPAIKKRRIESNKNSTPVAKKSSDIKLSKKTNDLMDTKKPGNSLPKVGNPEDYYNKLTNVILEHVKTVISKSISSSIDQVSPKEDNENQNSDKDENEDDDEEDASSLNSDDDAAIMGILQQQQELQKQQEDTNISWENNSHEIVESDSDEMSETLIAETIKTLNAHTDKELQNSIRAIDNLVKCTNQNENYNSVRSRLTTKFKGTSESPSNFLTESGLTVEIAPKPTRSNASYLSGSRTTTRKNLSFSNERLREIERHNQILLQKILVQKPRKGNVGNKNARAASSAVNRRKKQRQIDLDNQILKKKIEAISIRRAPALYR